jgi:hypothetical protein
MLAYPGCSVVNHANLTYNSTTIAAPKNSGYFGSGSPSATAAAKPTQATTTNTTTSTTNSAARQVNGANKAEPHGNAPGSGYLNSLEGNSDAKVAQTKVPINQYTVCMYVQYVCMYGSPKLLLFIHYIHTYMYTYTVPCILPPHFNVIHTYIHTYTLTYIQRGKKHLQTLSLTR